MRALGGGAQVCRDDGSAEGGVGGGVWGRGLGNETKLEQCQDTEDARRGRQEEKYFEMAKRRSPISKHSTRGSWRVAECMNSSRQTVAQYINCVWI
jgi:hypothetical protein